MNELELWIGDFLFSAYSYEEIEEKAKALRRCAASHKVKEDVSGVDVSVTMCRIFSLGSLAIFKFFCSSIVFFIKLCIVSMHPLKHDCVCTNIRGMLRALLLGFLSMLSIPI